MVGTQIKADKRTKPPFTSSKTSVLVEKHALKINTVINTAAVKRKLQIEIASSVLVSSAAIPARRQQKLSKPGCFTLPKF